MGMALLIILLLVFLLERENYLKIDFPRKKSGSSIKFAICAFLRGFLNFLEILNFSNVFML